MTTNAVVPMTKICSSLSRNFGYALTDKKASKNLLKSAGKDPMEVIERQKCLIIELSVGAYKEVVFPMLNHWKSGVSENENITVDNLTPGYDDKRNHIDTLIQLTFNGESVTICCYNTTQRIKVEGKGYVEFSKFLQTLLKERIDKASTNIDNYNKSVIAALSGKRKAISRPVRSVRYKSITQFLCNKCDKGFNNSTMLDNHNKLTHSNQKSLHNVTTPGLPIIDDISLMELSA